MLKKSFSIIEFIVCFSIILILLVISVPKFFLFNKFILTSQADKLFSTFSFLQQKAISSNLTQNLKLNLKENSYSYDNKIFKLVDNVKFGFLQNVNGPPSTPTKKIDCAISFEKMNDHEYKVTFYPDGKIKPGTLYLIDKDYKFMAALTCPVSQVSFIRKYKYDNNKWICVK
ncbi:hypothetical protein K9L05_02515 [Candidatus Babeliales bacterium]|nr:hypothetical protein [Candidatus Babeliales bacterium]MCF7899499.1 hypothetical protein [Candidatus Babeliales bacterium]